MKKMQKNHATIFDKWLDEEKQKEAL